MFIIFPFLYEVVGTKPVPKKSRIVIPVEQSTYFSPSNLLISSRDIQPHTCPYITTKGWELFLKSKYSHLWPYALVCFLIGFIPLKAEPKNQRQVWETETESELSDDPLD